MGKIGSYLGEHQVNIKDIRVIGHHEETLIVGLTLENIEDTTRLMSDLINLNGIIEVKRDA